VERRAAEHRRAAEERRSGHGCSDGEGPLAAVTGLMRAHVTRLRPAVGAGLAIRAIAEAWATNMLMNCRLLY
jgi:hypothetical protein